MLDALRDRVSNGYAKRFRSGARHAQPSDRSTVGGFRVLAVALPLLRGFGHQTGSVRICSVSPMLGDKDSRVASPVFPR